MKRTVAREIAIQLGFAAALTGQDPDAVVKMFFEPEHYASLASEDPLYEDEPTDKDLDFILRSVIGVIGHREELDGYIGRYAKGWRTERISRSAVAVLRQAMLEILYMEDITAATSINEAVELAKGYEDEEVDSFINGILGGFYRGENAPQDAQAEAPEEVPDD